MENVIWTAIVALIASVTTLTEFFKRIFKVDKPWFNEILGFIVAIATAYVAWILGKLPTFFEPEWECVLIEGITLGIATKYVYKLEVVKEVFDIFFQIFGNKLGGKWYGISK